MSSLFLQSSWLYLCSRFVLRGLSFIFLWRWWRSLCFNVFCICFVIFSLFFSMSSSLLCAYYVPVMWTFDKMSDLVSSGTVPRTFIQDTVACRLVATTVCSCGFWTKDMVWLGPVFLVPGFLRCPTPAGLVSILGVLVPDVFS